MSNDLCPCSSGLALSSCCGRYHAGARAPDAVSLMRSRYSAFALGLTDYICSTTHPAQQPALDMADIASWSRANHWLRLEVHREAPVRSQPPQHLVEFSAHYRDAAGQLQVHHELSRFVRIKGNWYFIQPE